MHHFIPGAVSPEVDAAWPVHGQVQSVSGHREVRDFALRMTTGWGGEAAISSSVALAPRIISAAVVECISQIRAQNK